MQPRLLKSSQQHEFKPAEYKGKNESGYQPLGDHVLIAFDEAADVTSGGILLTPEAVEKMTMAAETGVIVALGSDAFLWNGDRTRKWEGLKPGVGDRVYMERYSGQLLLGDDQKIYRLCGDRCIGAVKFRPDGDRLLTPEDIINWNGKYRASDMLRDAAQKPNTEAK